MGWERRGRDGMKWNRLKNPCEHQPGIALGLDLWDANTTATCECRICSTLDLNFVTFVPKHFIFFLLLNDILMSVCDTELHLINSTVLYPASAPCNLDELIYLSVMTASLQIWSCFLYPSARTALLHTFCSFLSQCPTRLDGASPAKQQC